MMWIGLILILAGIATSITGLVKAIKSRFTDMDAVIWSCIAVPLPWIGTLITILSQIQFNNVV